MLWKPAVEVFISDNSSCISGDFIVSCNKPAADVEERGLEPRENDWMKIFMSLLKLLHDLSSSDSTERCFTLHSPPELYTAHSHQPD